jgi:Tfp pilus assembly protein PilV
LTLLEVVVALAILGMMVLAVYGALTSGVTSLRMARENLRATQILVERTEALRLYTWDQLNTNYVPANFIVPYDIQATATNSGVLYYGTVSIGAANLGTTYSTDVRVVTVRLNWKTGRLPRSRELTTYVCRTGIQNYVY